ncbi:MAG TPA: SOS response-associated peptidase family protein [Fimbriimonadaceae bacterium]|nr:SOS response-associated peptidase family protein [Fimbriimonadaceae bacterium]
MCVVFSSNAEKHDLTIFGLEEEWEERWVRPTDPALIIVPSETGFSLKTMAWGFESIKPHERAPLFNARSETVFELPTFRESAESRRCVIPLRSFYEYQDVGERQKRSWRFRDSDARLMLVAGIWTMGQAISNAKLIGEVFTMLTCEPTDDVSEVHDRMPLVLTPDDAIRWCHDPALPQVDPSLRLTRSVERPPSAKPSGAPGSLF